MLSKCYYPFLFIIPLYAWYRYFKIIKTLKHKEVEDLKFDEKHNCVVMYSISRGMSGWPEYPDSIKLSINNLNIYNEPLLYFMDTARESLDVCIMIIAIKPILESILRAMDRGVHVRLITSFEHMKNDSMITKMVKKGLKILYFVNYEVESMMHCKYAVKDYSEENRSGYVVTGSANWTQSAFSNNYEDLVFTTSESLVQAYRNAFEDAWKFLENEKETNEYVKYSLNKKNEVQHFHFSNHFYKPKDLEKPKKSERKY